MAIGKLPEIVPLLEVEVPAEDSEVTELVYALE
jgi:hypothetical protein